MEMMSSIVSGKIDAIKGFFESLGNIDLSGVGEAIINGFLRGLQSAFENVKSFVGGIADWIAEHKGPISYDKRLLIPAGKAIMGGFDESLQANFKSVQQTISSMADRLNTSFKLTPEMALGTGNIGATSAASQIINNYSQSSNTSGIAGLVAQIANRPVQATFKIGEREIVKAIAKPLQNELNEMEELETLFKGGRLNER